MKNGVFSKAGAYVFFIFDPLCGFDLPMAHQAKAVASAITEIYCSIVGEMFINNS